MRINQILLGIILLMIFLISFSTTSVIAVKYEIGVDKNDVFIWECNVCDREKMSELLGNRWDENGTGFFQELKQGTRLKWLIKEIDDKVKIYNPQEDKEVEFFEITYKEWLWTNKDGWGDYDYEIQLFYYKNPKDYPDDFILPNVAPLLLPIPIDKYLKNIDLYEGYTIDTRSIPTISSEIERNDMKGKYPTENIKIQAIYNEKGILRSYKLYLENHEVIIDISLEPEITFPPLIWKYLIPAIVLLFYIGLIYLIYKKIIKN